MGFLETLRQQKEAESISKRQRSEQLAAQMKAAEETRQRQEAAEKALHERRKKQAERFHSESGIGSLLEKFRSILNGHSNYDARKPLDSVDPDSILDIVVWGRESINLKGGKFREKWLYIETNPNGEIIIHHRPRWYGVSLLSVPESSWREGPRVLEEALGKSYKHPIIYVGMYPSYERIITG